MSYYENIADYLDKYNDTGVEITIDELDYNSITFCVYTDEIEERVLDVIEDVLNFIDKGGSLLSAIKYYHLNKGDAECYTLHYRISVGEDYKTDEEMLQERKDYVEEQKIEEYRERRVRR